ncbi:MFS transporter [Metabacillus litoralis]|uniref:MFS transporter n=1 Tax=Metabacillus litoralis TaxID=152268 RepID=UPI001CFE0E7E|nr:MFS transporter [Metabacillus litoralis]
MGVKEILKLDRPLQILLFGVLLSHLGTYIVTPMLPIILKTEAGLTIGQIGIILASIAIAFQIGSIFGGILADRMGRGFIIGLGAIITAFGIVGFSFFTQFVFLCLTAIIMGLGTGLNAPSTKAAIAALASSENQTTAFSIRGIAANIGIGSAGLIVFFLLTDTSKLIFWIAGAIYVVLAVQSWIFLPKGCGNAPCSGLSVGAYREAFKNKPFIVFSGLSIFIWALYAQLSIALPLRATEILPEPKNIALIWTINSLIVVSTQSFITRKIIRKIEPLSALSIGIIFITIGIVSIFFTHSFIHLIFSGAVFVIGEMMILPTIDSTISQLSKAEFIGLFFALSNVVYGLGEAGGKSAGGRVLGLAQNTKFLPVIMYGSLGAILFAVVLLLKQWKPLRNSLLKAASKENKPKNSPRLTSEPSEHRTHPINSWEAEIFFRKKSRTE